MVLIYSSRCEMRLKEKLLTYGSMPCHNIVISSALGVCVVLFCCPQSHMTYHTVTLKRQNLFCVFTVNLPQSALLMYNPLTLTYHTVWQPFINIFNLEYHSINAGLSVQFLLAFRNTECLSSITSGHGIWEQNTNYFPSSFYFPGYSGIITRSSTSPISVIQSKYSHHALSTLQQFSMVNLYAQATNINI